MKVVNCRETTNFTVYIGRGSPLGNPFTHLPLERTKALVQCTSVQEAVSNFELWAQGDDRWDNTVPITLRHNLIAAIKRLEGKDVLGCFCVVGSPCHGQVIKRLWSKLGTRKRL